VEQLLGLLSAEPNHYSISAESVDEAYAFILAALVNDDTFSPRVLVVNESREWSLLIDSQEPLVLVPRLKGPYSIGLATKHGHWVVVPRASGQLAQIASITLSKIADDELIKALKSMGIDEETAEDVVQYSRGYLSIIRRHPALGPIDPQKPDWATSETAVQIIPALLVGSWMADNKNDCEKLAYLAGVSYDMFEQNIHKWSAIDDHPTRRVGNKWQIVSHQDAWLLLSPYISAGILERFGNVAMEVLGELDPRFDSPPGERWFANAMGKVTKYSSSLRRGLAVMLAFLGSYGDKDCKNVGLVSVQDQVSTWVKHIMTHDISEKRWYSMAKELPFLVEASPEVFVEAVESDLRGETPLVLSLFKDEGYMGGCPHSGLLWGLEAASWNLNYLACVVRILAKLDRIDPGGRYVNRPANTLQEIFRGWFPQTTAPLEDRLKIIDRLFDFEPEAAWKLLLNLLPKGVHEVSSPIHRPCFRDWARGWKKGATREEISAHTLAMADRLLELALRGPDSRWRDLLKVFPELPTAIRDRVLLELGNKASTFPLPFAVEICEDLRRLIANHREFSNADWALPKTYVEQLDEIYKKLVPTDLVQRHSFLFDTPIPNLTSFSSGLDYEQKMNLIEKERTTALEEIWANLGISGIRRLATSVKMPWILGSSLGRFGFTDEIEATLLGWLSDKNDLLVRTAMGYANVTYQQKQDWLSDINSKYKTIWSDEAWVNFCLSLPFSKVLFELLESLSQNVRKEYWRKVSIFVIQAEDARYANYVVKQLLASDRPLAAIEAAGMYLHSASTKGQLSGDVLASALELAAVQPSEQSIAEYSIGYDISNLLKELQCRADIDKNRLAFIEWIYLPVSDHNGRQPINLINEALSNPVFYVEMICVLYPPNEGEFAKLSPELKQKLARNAWYLLELLDRLPGQDGSASVDATKLQEWVQLARAECKQKNRGKIGDECIGKLLSRSPTGKDGVWPHEAVRDIIEQCESTNLENGIEMGRYNNRGVTLRAFKNGGKQERDIVENYEKKTSMIKYVWPRTAMMLIRIANSYRRDAKVMDQLEELE
jgi:hypothetical protein